MPPAPARLSPFRRRLLAWWDAGRRELPWRFPQDRADPYRVWLAEVMLQQTRIRTAIPYYDRFVARFPTLEALARADEEDVLALWSGLGYYARAQNLLAAAREAVARHGGLPADLAALRALPGFGPYTAGAVASIAFSIRVPAVDGNATRVLSRLFLVDGDPGARDVRERLHALAGALVPGARPGDFNQALMDLGSTVCARTSPACGRCPLAALCAARRAGRTRDVPRPRARPRRRLLRMACALVSARGRILLARRPPGGLLGGLWGLPAAEVDGAARPREALARSLRASLGLRVAVGGEAGSARRVLTHRDLELVAYRCALRSAPPEGLRWARPAELAGLGVSAAMRALLAAAREVR